MAGDKWFLASDGQGYGPFSPDQLRRFVDAGLVDHDDLVWREGDSESIPASTVGNAPPPLPAAAWGPSPSPVLSTPASSHRPSKLGLWLSLSAILLAMLGGAGWFTYERGWLPLGKRSDLADASVAKNSSSNNGSHNVAKEPAPTSNNGSHDEADEPAPSPLPKEVAATNPIEQKRPSPEVSNRHSEGSPTTGNIAATQRTMRLGDWEVVTAPKNQRPTQPAWNESEDGRVIKSSPVGFTELRSKDRFTDFRMIFQWRFPHNEFVGVNGSGVVIRSDGWNDFGLDPRGIEVDLRPRDSDDGFFGTGCLIAYDTPIQVPAHRRKKRHIKRLTAPTLRVPSDWNRCEITCQGDHLEVFINGRLVNEAEGLPIQAGHIVLRSQRAAVEFRDIIIHDLTGAASGTHKS